MYIVDFITVDQLSFLDANTWDALATQAICQVYDKSEQIFEAGTVENSFKIVLSGKVRLMRKSANGDVAALEKLRGDTLGSATSHMQVPKLFSAYALESETRILSADMHNIYALCSRHDVLMKFIMFDLSRTVVDTKTDLYALREISAEKRVAKQIGHLWSQDNKIAYNQTEIGEIVGVSRVTVSKTLAELEKLGIIQRNKGRIEVTDLWGLRRWIDQGT